MAFNQENKISWDELAPSTQELFKELQSQIETEKVQRKKSDDDLKDEIDNIINRINQRLKKFDDLVIRIQLLQEKLDSYFDSNNKLVFPNGDKFWIS